MPLRQATKDRRAIDRNRQRISIRYGHGNASFLGYTMDLGKAGMFLQGNQLFPPGTELRIEMSLPDGGGVALGIVRWVKEVPPAFRRSMRGGMGIEFLAEKQPGKS